MTSYEIAMLKAGTEIDKPIHAILGQVFPGAVSPVRPYSTNTNWAKVAQLQLTQQYGQGTLLLQDIYGQLDKQHHYSAMWRKTPDGTPGPNDKIVWVSGDTEEIVICRALLLAHYGHYSKPE